MAANKKKLVVRVVVILAAILVVIQLVPYGRNHANPATVAEPQWDSARTRELFFQACRDCHSNETVWPWYSHVAPVSWLVQSDVDEGREELNVSNWGHQPDHGRHAANEVRHGEMPLWFYLPMHPEARLSPEDKQALIDGLEATFGKPAAGGEAEEHDDD